MATSERKYFIDWVRVIAIGLLIIYHTAVGFQPWGMLIGFIAAKDSWQSLWIPMTMLNVWRIPLLFFVSGMGVYFAMEQRTWKALLLDRTLRILVPFVFGTVVIFPISFYIWRLYYHMGPDYQPHPGHLWFLGNIYVYILFLMPFFYYFKKRENGRMVRAIKTMFSYPSGLFAVIATSVAEAVLVNPMPYELYSLTLHGFILGLLAFFWGFCFVLSGQAFWQMLVKWRWVFVVVATALFTVRLLSFKSFGPGYLIAIESDFWIFSVLGFACRYLNKPSAALTYFSQAAYPVYILHMIFLYLGSAFIFDLTISTPLQFVLVVLFTFLGSLGFYEFVVRRVRVIRPLFGLKFSK